MEIRTKYLPSFRLVLFLLALPVFGLAQQFPVNNQKIVQGVGTTAQGISSYSSSPPTVNPTAATFRHVTSLHMDTVLQVQYVYKRPRWYPISTVRRATPPPATASSGSTTIDYTESIWQSTADSLAYYYEEENACWQPIGTYLSSTTPVDVAATGSTGAICYGYGLWYDPDVDSIYAQQGATWTAIGAGGPVYEDWTAAADSGTPAVIGDGETVTYAGGYGINTVISGNTITSTADTSQLVTPYDISGLPSGTGTDQRIVVWTGTNSQGNSTQLQSAAGVTLDANLAYRITGGTTASRPTGAAGMMYWNTSNVWWDYHNGTAWFNPLRSATATGLGTAGRVFYADASGLAAADDLFLWDATGNTLGVGVAQISGATISSAGNIAFSTSAAIVQGTSDGADNRQLGVGGGGSNTESRGGNFTVYGNEVSNFEGAAIFQAGLIGVTNTRSGSIWFNTQNLYQGLFSRTTGNFGVGTSIFSGTTMPAVKGHFVENDATTAARSPVMRLDARSTGTPAVGFGPSLQFQGEEASGDLTILADEAALYTSHTNGSETADLVWRTLRLGTLTESLRSLGNGTLQIATLTGTGTKIGGFTAGNIATELTQGYGINVTAGALEVDTTQVATPADLIALGAGYVPLTFLDTVEVNTAGYVFRIRDAGAYPDVFMNANYWLAASSVNNYIDVGSAANRVHVISDGLIELNSSVNTSLITTGRLLIDGDSTVIDATLPVNTNATHVLVRDASTQRLEEKALSSFGNGIISALPLGNVTINTDNYIVLTDPASDLVAAWNVDQLDFFDAVTGDDTYYSMTEMSASLSVPYEFVLLNGAKFEGSYVSFGNQTFGPGATRFMEDEDNGTNYIGVTVPASLTTTETFSYRNTDGTASQTIVTGIPPVTATLNFGNTSAGTVSDLTVTVAGAAVGDLVTLGVHPDCVPAGGTFFAWVSDVDEVTVRFANNALVTAYDPASGDFKVRVDK